MIKYFDLFELHDPKQDKKSKSWIKLGGKKLIARVRNILLKEIQNGKSLREISYIISEKEKIDFFAVYRALYAIMKNKWERRKYYIAIPVLLGFIKAFGLEREKWIFIDLSENIVSSASRSRPIRAVKKLTNELAILAGVHAADGTMLRQNGGKQYKIAISDEYENSVVAVKNLVEKIFEIKIKVKKSDWDNSYIIIIINKAICRYFNKFFKFKYGYKTTTVRIPKIIKNSNFGFQRGFVRGFVTFDGCVDLGGYFRLNIRNKGIINEIRGIMRKDGIYMKVFDESTREGINNIRHLTLDNKKFLYYFLKGTEKYERAKFFIKGNPKANVFKLFPERFINKVSLKDIFVEAKRLRIFDLAKIRDNIGVSERTLRNYLRILIISGYIIEIKNNSKLDYKIKSLEQLSDTTAIKLNNKFRKKLFNSILSRYKQNNVASIIGTNTETISLWKRWCGINTKFIRKLLKLSDFSESDLLNCIEILDKNLYIFNFNKQN